MKMNLLSEIFYPNWHLWQDIVVISLLTVIVGMIAFIIVLSCFMLFFAYKISMNPYFFANLRMNSIIDDFKTGTYGDELYYLERNYIQPERIEVEGFYLFKDGDIYILRTDGIDDQNDVRKLSEEEYDKYAQIMQQGLTDASENYSYKWITYNKNAAFYDHFYGVFISPYAYFLLYCAEGQSKMICAGPPYYEMINIDGKLEVIFNKADLFALFDELAM